jgi:uncharacterized alkaline shock family protein YloU
MVTRRAVVDVVRAAVVGSYGVTGLTDRRRMRRLLGVLRLAQPGIEVSLHHGIAIELSVTVAHGLPIAEVARQLDSTVRYAVRRAIERDVDRVVVHVNGLRVLPLGQRHPANRPQPERAASAPAPGGPVTMGDPPDVAPASGLAGRGGMLGRSAGVLGRPGGTPGRWPRDRARPGDGRSR